MTTQTGSISFESTGGLKSYAKQNYATLSQIKGQFATCGTGASTAAKVATIVPTNSNWTLYEGATVTVKFTSKNETAIPTLNVNGTGAKIIKDYAGNALISSTYNWPEGAAMSFTYDGTYWRIQDSNLMERVHTAETSIEQNANNITLKANASDVYNKTSVDGLIAQEVIDRDAAIEFSANDITSTVASTYTTKAELDTRYYDEDAFIYRQVSEQVKNGIAHIKTLKGNTIVWNQVAPETYVNTVVFDSSFKPSLNNKLLLVSEATLKEGQTSGTVTIYGRAPDGGSNVNLARLSYTANGRGSVISTVSIDGLSGGGHDAAGYIWGYVSTTITAANLQLFDLTVMFGAGNEPTTVEEFEAMFPEPYYPYDAGSLLSVNIEGVKSVGFNQWDGIWEEGTISVDNGTNASSINHWRTKNYIPVSPLTEYYAAGVPVSGKTGTLRARFYDASKTYIGYTAASGFATLGCTFTTPANCRYMRFAPEYANITDKRICINISDPALNGTYKPYAENVREIPAATYFPTGIKSAGTAYDELTSDKAVTRIGAVDLGTLNWSRSQNSDSTYRYYTSDLSEQVMPVANNTSVGNLKSADYQARAVGGSEGVSTSNTGIAVNPESYLVIYDANKSNFTTSEFKTAMNGVILYYELATPTETAIDPPLNMTYPVEHGGTEAVIMPTSEMTAPVPMAIQYGLNAMDALNDNSLRIANAETAITTAKSEIKQTTDNISLEVSKINSAKYVNSSTASWTLANIKIYAAEGYNTTFNVTSTDGIRVGDTVYIKGTDSTRSCPIYIKTTVRAINSSTQLATTSHGYEDVLPVDTIKSTINQSADSVKIAANHVEINGATTFKNGNTTTTLGSYLDGAYDPIGAADTVGTIITQTRSWYAECTTAAATAAKVAIISPVTTEFNENVLTPGTIVLVKFTNTNDADVANLTLSVNGTTAKNIKYIYNGSYSNIPGKNYLKGGQMYTFTYDGTYWIVEMNYNTNTTYNLGNNQVYNNLKVKGNIAAESIAVGNADGYIKAAAGVKFDLSYQIIWVTKALTTSSTGTDLYAYNYSSIYDRNLATNHGFSGGTAGSVVYLVGTVNGNEITLANTYLTTTPPVNETNPITVYIPIGKLGLQSTGANYFYFECLSTPVLYAYLDKAFRQVTPTEVVSEQYIYKQAVSGTNTMSEYDTWVTSTAECVTGTPPNAATGQTPAWSTKRPTYQTNYPVIFVAKQIKRLDGTVTCTTPVKDDSMTIIDGGHITTGTIDASKVVVDKINAAKITSGYINADRIESGSISVGKINASSGTFNTANIPNLDAAKITSGYINADRIESGSISVGKIDATSGTFNTANIPELTANHIKANVIDAVNNGSGTINADKINVSSINIGDLAGEIGGRNLVLGTGSLKKGDTVWSYRHSAANGSLTQTADGIKYDSTSSNAGIEFKLMSQDCINDNETLTISFEARGTMTSIKSLYLLRRTSEGTDTDNISYGDCITFTNISETEWTRYTYTWSSGSSATVNGTKFPAELLLFWGKTNVGWIEIKNNSLKLEKGSKPTDWTPAPEDVQSAIDSINDPIASKTYTGVTITANNDPSGWLYFGNIKAINYYEPWRIKYIIHAKITTSTDSTQVSTVVIEGAKNAHYTYQTFNTIANTSYRPIYAHVLYTTTQTGFNSGYGHLLGIRFQSAYWGSSFSATDWPREITIEVTETKNCNFVFADSMFLYANAQGTGTTNYATRYSFDGTTQGFTETGDRNTTSQTRWQNLIKAAAAITAGRIICGTDSGYRNIAANVQFDLSYPLLYCNATKATNETSDNNFLQINGITVTNNGTVTNAAQYKTVYLKGTIDGNVFTISASPFMTCTPPTTADGYIYIPLGMFYNSTTAIYFNSSKDLYAYLDTKFRQVTPTEIVATHRIYYRTTNTINNLAAPIAAWIEEATNNVYDTWTTKVPPLANDIDSSVNGYIKYPYLYTCEQRKRLDGTIQCTKVLLDENTTIIDGGNIITNSITANQIVANAITTEKIDTEAITADKIAVGVITGNKLNISDVITVGGFALEEDVSSLDDYVRGSYYILTEDTTAQANKTYYEQYYDYTAVEINDDTDISRLYVEVSQGVYELTEDTTAQNGITYYQKSKPLYRVIAVSVGDSAVGLYERVENITQRYEQLLNNQDSLSKEYSDFSDNYNALNNQINSETGLSNKVGNLDNQINGDDGLNNTVLDLNNQINGENGLNDQISGENGLNERIGKNETDLLNLEYVKSVLTLASDTVAIGKKDQEGHYVGYRTEMTNNGINIIDSNNNMLASYGSMTQIGQSNQVHVTLDGEKMLFLPGGKTSEDDAVAFIKVDTQTNESVFYITRSVVVKDMFLGENKWKFYKRNNNNLSLKWMEVI